MSRSSLLQKVHNSSTLKFGIILAHVYESCVCVCFLSPGRRVYEISFQFKLCCVPLLNLV